ncbi:MAG: hypothetical protein ACSHYA_19090 [Opitutaceae bacterium]
MDVIYTSKGNLHLLTEKVNGTERHYRIRYKKPIGERKRASMFFKRNPNGLFPKPPTLTQSLRKLPLWVSNLILLFNSYEEQWSILEVSKAYEINDEDLDLLKHLQEIEIVKVFSDEISDDGIKKLLNLNNISQLTIYSASVTDSCLKHIAKMKGLKSLDCQGCSRISSEAFSRLIEDLPSIEEYWSPDRNPNQKSVRNP